MLSKNDFIPPYMKFNAFFLNISYMVLGIFSSGVGLFVHFYNRKTIQELISPTSNPSASLVLMGIILLITATFGFVGVMRENLHFLRWYKAALLFLLVMHVAIGILSLIPIFSPPIVLNQVKGKLKNAVITYQDDCQSAAYIDEIQASMQCCGIGHQGYKDWMMNPYFACTDDNFSAEKCGVPPSCCKFNSMENIDSTCGFGTTNMAVISQMEASSVINTQGCIPTVKDIARNSSVVLSLSAFGVAVTLVYGIGLSSLMLNTLEMKVTEYWKKFENNMKHGVPNSSIYSIPDPANSHVPKSSVNLNGLWPLHYSSLHM